MFNLDAGKILDFILRSVLGSHNDQFFEKLCRSLSVALDLEHVYISLVDDEHAKAKTIAYSISGFESDTHVEYGIATSPCQHSIEEKTFLVASDLSLEYPDFSLINEIEAQGYIGIALHSSEGRLVGFIGGICLDPISEEKQQVVRRMFALFANQVESELGRLKSQDALNNLAYLDYLTKLANRHSFETRMTDILERSILDSERYALIVVDLDRFKQLNDHCGHQAGDLALQQISARMKAVMGPDDLLARIGGDEFTVIVKKTSVNHAVDVATRLMDEIDSYNFVHEGQIFKLGASMGIASIDPKLGNRDKIFKIADSACYLAKEKGRGRIEIAEMNSVLIDEHIRGSAWPFRIKNALAEGRFKLMGQPIQCIAKDDGKTRLEILVRMIGEDGEIINPSDFLPAAERFGLITSIDRWVVTNSFEWLSKVKNLNIKININLNTKSFSDEAFKKFLVETLQKHRLLAPRVVFELTESSAFADPKSAAKFMNKVIAYGSTFALDDFGSGYSNLAILSTLPVSIVKIDGSFITDLLTNDVKKVIVKSCTQVSHAMKMKVVAEFVQNFETVLWLKENGVDFGQGYFYSPPCELSHFEVIDGGRDRKIA